MDRLVGQTRPPIMRGDVVGRKGLKEMTIDRCLEEKRGK